MLQRICLVHARALVCRASTANRAVSFLKHRSPSVLFQSLSTSSAPQNEVQTAIAAQKKEETADSIVKQSTSPTAPSNSHKIIKTLLLYVWPAGQPALRARVAAALALLVGAKLINVQVPFLFKQIADTMGAEVGEHVSHAAAHPDLMAAIPLSLLLGYGIARSTAAGFAELRNAIFASVAQRAIRLVSRDVFRHLLQLDLKFHLDRQTGAVTRVMDRGSRSINFVLTSLVFNVVPTALEILLVTGVFAVQCGWEYAATTLLTLVAYVAYTVRITTWRTGIRKELNKLENEASSTAVDSLLNYESVKYFNNEEAEVDKYDRALAGLDKASLRTQNSLSLLNFGQNTIFSIGLTAAMIMAARDIAAGSMTVGDLILVNGLLFQLSIPLNFVGMVYREVQQGLIDMEAMFNLLDTPSKVKQHPDAKQLVVPTAATISGEMNLAPLAPVLAAEGGKKGQLFVPYASLPAISFKDVQFSYNPARRVLDGVSFDVEQGQTVAVVGTSGCGKSTLIRLLFRFFDVDETQPYTPQQLQDKAHPAWATQPGIYLYGQDIRYVTQDSLRRAIGIIPQDLTLFNASIHTNIAYGAPGGVASVTLEQVQQAAKFAHVHDTIMGFSKGYNTQVGERGLKLSGGEKQRVAIARAVLKNAPILLCDEATSALDSTTEASVMSALRSLSSHRTTILVAHRLSTVQGADRIIVMDKGQVVEEGTHAQLLGLSPPSQGSRKVVGLYARMWDTQRKAQQAAHHKTAPAHGAVIAAGAA